MRARKGQIRITIGSTTMKTRISSPLLAALLAVSQGAYASSIVWTNAVGGKWSGATNWSPNQVPTSGDSAFITNNGTYTVTVDVYLFLDSLTLGGARSEEP